MSSGADRTGGHRLGVSVVVGLACCDVVADGQLVHANDAQRQDEQAQDEQETADPALTCVPQEAQDRSTARPLHPHLTSSSANRLLNCSKDTPGGYLGYLNPSVCSPVAE